MSFAVLSSQSPELKFTKDSFPQVKRDFFRHIMMQYGDAGHELRSSVIFTPVPPSHFYPLYLEDSRTPDYDLDAEGELSRYGEKDYDLPVTDHLYCSIGTVVCTSYFVHTYDRNE